jgi:succinate-semialdehyde dehydrogenase/glutarate-semialdehyde dehydrogenase
VNATEQLVIGDGMAENTQLGPLANIRQLEKMQALIADAVALGARVLTGGKRRPRPGFFFEPTVLADVPMEARIMHEEPFGPIA